MCLVRLASELVHGGEFDERLDDRLTAHLECVVVGLHPFFCVVHQDIYNTRNMSVTVCAAGSVAAVGILTTLATGYRRPKKLSDHLRPPQQAGVAQPLYDPGLHLLVFIDRQQLVHHVLQDHRAR